MSKRFELGQKVQCGSRLFRRSTWINRVSGRHWEAMPIPIHGIYIGWRIYANGVVDGNDERYFVAKEHIKVALVVENARSNPVPVLYSELCGTEFESEYDA